MNEVKFTEGEWIVVPYGDGNQLVICSDDENWRIAFMATPGQSPGAMEKIRADANLLAASKELYAALERLIDLHNGPPLIRETFEWADAIEVARSALAKARGEEK